MNMTYEYALTQLNRWLEIEARINGVGSYTVGDRTLTYRNLKEIRESIDYWQGKVISLKKGGITINRSIPFY